MKKTFWHFGDSFTTPNNNKGWGYKLSEKLDCTYKNLGQFGGSNYQILCKIIENLTEINKNDFVLINWSFLSRGTFVLDNDFLIVSTNRYFDDEIQQLSNPKSLNNTEIQILKSNLNLLTNNLENSLQHNVLNFNQAKIIEKVLKGIKKCNVFSVFLEKNYLYSDGKKIEWPLDNFGLSELYFDKHGYYEFLKKNEYLGKSIIDTHYKDGITDIIAEEYYKRINKNII